MKWISIKEQLPKDGQRCIIWDINCNVSMNNEVVHIYTANFYKGEYRENGPWRSCDSGFGDNENPWCWIDGPQKWFSQDVTHWMPLPQPPKEGE